jgi:hypothetical protein
LGEGEPQGGGADVGDGCIGLKYIIYEYENVIMKSPTLKINNNNRLF